MSKIVLIHPQAGINWKSHSSVFAVELARRLDNYFEVELLSGAECGSFSRPISSLLGGNSPVTNPLVANMINRWLQQPKMTLDRMTSFVPCIIHLLNNPVDLILPQNGYGDLFAATCVRAIKQTPILFTQHNTLNNQERSLQRNLTLKPNRLITLNPIVAQQARTFAPHQSVETIPWGINPTEFSPEGKAMITGLSRPTIICIANLERHGNQRVELTIEAVSRLPEASLLICGSGKDRDYFQALGDRLLGVGRCQIRTFAYAQMPQVYRSGNIFTSAAVHEPCGLKYIEAMACGLPVVATDDAVRRYLIGNGGITCDVSNLDLYAESLQLAIDRQWRGGQPRQNALRFSWHGITLLYYQAILKTMATSDQQFTFANSHKSVKSIGR